MCVLRRGIGTAAMQLQSDQHKHLMKFFHLNFRIKLVLLSLLAFSLIILSCSFHPFIGNGVGYYFADLSIKTYGAQGVRRLENILLAERKPKPGKSIFFHETTCHTFLKSPELKTIFDCFGSATQHSNATQNTLAEGLSRVRLSARQACAVESAALHNPNFDIFVLFATADHIDTALVQPVLDALFSYPNVHLRNINLWTYAAGTPTYEWLQGGKLFKSKFVLTHIADFLRFLTLWRWGGTHLDLDVIVKRSLEDLPPNFSGLESKVDVSNAVMNFAPDGVGHEVASLCLSDFQANFDGNAWGYNGPGVITRVLQHLCKTNNTSLMNREHCMGFNVYPMETFYAVPWQMWEHFFDAQYLEETMKQTEHSYIAHVWNKLSMKRRVKVGSNVAYVKLAEMHCPKVYAVSGEFL